VNNTGGYGAAKMTNYSNTESTLFFSNNGSGGITDGIFNSLLASTSSGTCGIGGEGDLSCTGQVKALVATHRGARRVETFSVQSLENWLEGFGSGNLERGVAVVKIDPIAPSPLIPRRSPGFHHPSLRYLWDSGPRMNKMAEPQDIEIS
jgi:hypothetical protein